MNVRRSTLTAIGIASAVALSSIVASPVSAGDSRALTKPEMMASLMKVADLPTNVRSRARSSTVRSAPVRTTEYLTGSDVIGPDLCFDTDGKELNGRRPATSANADITLESGGLTGVNMSTNNNIYNYGTTAKARSAWRALVKKARKCNGTVAIDKSEHGTSADVVVQTEFAQTPRLLGARGFTITADVSVKISGAGAVDIQILGDQYAAYRIAGPAIERVEFARISLDGSSVGINEDRQAFTRTETDRVAKRLWARWVN